MTTRIALMRHGETDWNAAGRWQGWAPVPLNTRGHEQAAAAAAAMAAAGITRIISSDLLRCRQTIAPVAETLGLTVETDRRWREVDLGNWQGLTRDEIMAWDGEQRTQFERTTFIDRAFPDGESQRQHVARTAAGLTAIVQNHPGEHVLVCTHGGSIRCAVYHLRGEAIHVSGNCTLTRLLHEPTTDRWTVLDIAQAPERIVWETDQIS